MVFWRHLASFGILIGLFVSPNSVYVVAQVTPTIFTAHRGINLAAPFARTTRTGPFRVEGQISAYHGLARYFSAKSIARLARVGVELVRIPTNPVPLLENKDLAREALFDELINAVAEFNAAGMVAVIDLHFWSPADKSWTEEAILDGTTGSGFTAFRKVVAQLAKKLTAVPHGHVALELLNEPQECRRKGTESWSTMQKQLFDDVRNISAELPVVVTGCGGQLDGLMALRNFTFSDENVIYTFHFYEPFVFTHQSVAQYYPFIRHLPYPSSAGSLHDALENVTVAAEESSSASSMGSILAVEKAKLQVRRYFSDGADRSHILQRFGELENWARHEGVPSNRIFLGEFAALSLPPNTTESDYASQLRWISDVRQSAETKGFSYAYWLYSDKNGPLVDPTTLKLNPYLGPALGLSSPAFLEPER
jgi:hypothetical protein